MKTSGLLVTAAAVTALATAACSPTNATGAGGGAGGTVTPIGYSAVFLQDPAQTSMIKKFQAEADGQDLQLLPPVSANGDAAQQDTDIRNLVTAGAKSLFVIPADPTAVVPALKFARGKGLPVVGLMLGPDGEGADVSLQVDNKDVGRQACEFLAAKVGPSGSVLHIQGDMRAVTARDRDQGFRDCMKTSHPGIRVTVKSAGQWDPAAAAASASAAVNTTPDLGGIFMASDGYVDSVAQAISSAGRKVPSGQQGHVYTVSVDGTPAALGAIKDGRLDATLAQPVHEFVTYGLEYLTKIRDGQRIEPGKTAHGSVVETTPHGYPADVFPALLITAENAGDASNWANQS